MYLYSGISHIARNIIIIALTIFARLPAHTPLVTQSHLYLRIYFHLGIHAVLTISYFLIIKNLMLEMEEKEIRYWRNYKKL